MNKVDVIVLGAGMVGVCSALALQKKGLKVTLVDGNDAGSETSFGNAGIITPSSLIPFNNPRLLKSLPGFLGNKSNGFRYSLPYALSEIATLVHFISFAKRQSTQQRIHHLYQLIERSGALHKAQSEAAGCSDQLRPSGWLKLYRTADSWKKAQYEQDIYDQYNIQTRQLSSTQVLEFEPNLNDIYYRGSHIEQALSVASPGDLVKAYVAHYHRIGGVFLKQFVERVQKEGELWQLTMRNGEVLTSTKLVIAAGPWSKQLLADLDIKLPMIFERGGHREYHSDQQSLISSPVHDVDGSFVATPIENGIRLSCGVELNHQLAEHNNAQLDIVEHNARKGLTFAAQATTQWQGARPTMPDSMPVIGPSKMEGLWFNTGHQHIGFSTGPGSGEILAKYVMGESLTQDQQAFSPARFKL
jgi:D-amino-acid dehydrogenase